MKSICVRVFLKAKGVQLQAQTLGCLSPSLLILEMTALISVYGKHKLMKSIVYLHTREKAELKISHQWDSALSPCLIRGAAAITWYYSSVATPVGPWNNQMLPFHTCSRTGAVALCSSFFSAPSTPTALDANKPWGKSYRNGLLEKKKKHYFHHIINS